MVNLKKTLLNIFFSGKELKTIYILIRYGKVWKEVTQFTVLVDSHKYNESTSYYLDEDQSELLYLYKVTDKFNLIKAVTEDGKKINYSKNLNYNFRDSAKKIINN